MIIDYQQFPSGKKYVFIRDGRNRVFLRNVLFIRHTSKPSEIVIVREWGSKTEKGAWEPPKGQMEWKELEDTGIRRGQDITMTELNKHMRKGVLREIMEEAKIMPEELKGVRKMELSYTEEFPKAGKDAFFRYQFWEATLDSLTPAKKRLHDLVTNTDWQRMLPPDVQEKDGVDWWSPTSKTAWTKIRGAFSFKITQIYFNYFFSKSG